MSSILNLKNKKVIGRGTYGIIYSVGDKVVKVSNYLLSNKAVGEFEEKRLEDEYTVQRDLYEKGVRVPRPQGIVRVMNETKKSVGILMDKINGDLLWNSMGAPDYDLLQEMRIKEEDKAKYLGFNIIDRHGGNAMVDHSRKVFLIDFGGCSSPENLEKMVA